MIYRKFLLVLLAFSTFVASLSANPEGEKLFSTLCKACHHLEIRLVGPPLKNVSQRHNEEWLLKFIKSSTSMIASGDKAAIELFNTYNKIPMPDQNLTDDEIRSILSYILEASSPAEGAAISRPETVKSNAKPLKFSDFRFWIIYTITVVLTIVAVYYKAEMALLTKKVESRGDAEA
jgi:cytochrome c551/c552